MKTAVLFLGLVVLGCGPSDNEDDKTPTTPTTTTPAPAKDPLAPKKCQMFVRAICVRFLECNPDVAATASVDECYGRMLAGMDDGNGCSRVTQVVGAKYDQCITDLATWSCQQISEGVTPPACLGAMKRS